MRKSALKLGLVPHVVLRLLYAILFLRNSCEAAAQMLQSNGELKRKWTWAVEWLNDELDRVSQPLSLISESTN